MTATTTTRRGLPRPSATRRPIGATRTRSAVVPTGYLLLFAVVVVLNLMGLVMVLSASSVFALRSAGSPFYYFLRQAMWLTLGAALFVVAIGLDHRRLRRIATPLVVGSLFLLVLVLVPGLGSERNGATRWLGYGPLSVQPSEFAKLGMILFAADLLARRRHRMADPRLTLVPVVAVFSAMAVLILLQPNLGTTLVIAAITFAMLFSAGTPLGPLAKVGAAGGFLATTLAMGAGYRRRRLLAFMRPWSDVQDTTYQTIQSQVSLVSGGLFGLGLGASRSKWGYLPEAHTDFIFAIIGEELGLLGCTLVVGLFVALGFLGIRTALWAADPFSRLMAVGITTWFCLQAFINIGAVIGVLPITGVPLPFLSFGGSSLLNTMLAAGLLLNVARNGRSSAR